MTSSKRPVWLYISLVWGLGIAVGLLAVGLQRGGFLTTTDVGELPQFAQMQAQLRPLDICRVEYALRDKRGARRHLDTLFIETCSRGAYDHVLLPVPTTWDRKHLGFELRRWSTSDRFALLVEKRDVPFPDLVAAVEAFTPVIVAEFPSKLAEVRAQMEVYDRDVTRRREAEEARKRGAADSYPAR